MNKNHMTTGLGLVALLGASATLAQNDNRPDLTLGLDIGAEYVSNLTVTELDTAADTSDVATLFEAGADLNWQPTNGLTLDAGYNFSASRHRDQDLYDLDMHMLFADLSHDFDQLTVGGNIYHVEADLGSSKFMTLTQYSLYTGRLFGNQYYLRGALNFADRSFARNPGRDADSSGVGIDAFRFFNNGRSNILLAVQFDDEDTAVDQFAYRGNTARLRFSHRFNIANRDTQWQIGYRWHDRDYRHAHPVMGVRRDDTWHIIDSRLVVSLNDNLNVVGRWEYGDYQSNLPSADYSSNRLSATLQLRF